MSSNDNLVPVQASCAFNPSKLQPRGAAERQDFSALRDFLDANPTTHADKKEAANIYDPKSKFEWDSDDDDIKVKTPTFLLNPRHTRRRQRQAAGNGVTISNGGAVEVSPRMLGTSSSVHDFMSGKKDSIAGRRSDVGKGVGAGVNHLIESPSKPGAVKRTSVLQIFDDPVRDHNVGELIVVVAMVDKATDGLHRHS